MPIARDLPVSARTLVPFVLSLEAPLSLILACFGMNFVSWGRLKADARRSETDRLLHPPVAILARLLSEGGDLQLPLCPIKPPAFAAVLEKVLGGPVDVASLAIALGHEKSAGWRWMRQAEVPRIPTLTLMSIVSTPQGGVAAKWALIIAEARKEARLRGLEDVFSRGTWGPRHQNLCGGGGALLQDYSSIR